jgi:hypothetical protein
MVIGMVKEVKLIIIIILNLMGLALNLIIGCVLKEKIAEQHQIVFQ